MQTSKSMIWRRRWFNFYANEIKLFKSELVSRNRASVAKQS